jgi:hypothetical protein
MKFQIITNIYFFYFSVFQSLELVWENIIIMNGFCWFEKYRLFETAVYILNLILEKSAF